MAELTLWQRKYFQGSQTAAPNTGIDHIDGGALSLKLQANKPWTIYEGQNYQGQSYNIGKTADYGEPSNWGGNDPIKSARPSY